MNRSFFKPLPWILIICVNSLIFDNSIYGKALTLNDQKIFDFASFLYQRREYYRAISEYQRLEHFFPGSRLMQKSVLQIGKAYMAGGELRKAISHWQKQLENIKLKNKNYYRIKLLLGISFLEIGKEKTYSLRKRDIQSAFQNFSHISNETVEAERIKSFVEEWESRECPSYKSPWIAGSLSAVLPGSGSFYVGRRMEGVYAFFITGLFYLAAMDSIRRQEEKLAYVFVFFTLSFYGGNIYTAVNSAHQINDKMETDELRRLRQKYGIWFSPK